MCVRTAWEKQKEDVNSYRSNVRIHWNPNTLYLAIQSISAWRAQIELIGTLYGYGRMAMVQFQTQTNDSGAYLALVVGVLYSKPHVHKMIETQWAVNARISYEYSTLSVS